AGGCARYGAADTAVEIADHRRRFVIVRQSQSVRRDDIETGKPDALLVLAALADDLVEQFELRKNGVEPQLEEDEPALNVLRRGLPAFVTQPAQELLNASLQLAPALGKKAFDRNLGGRQKTRSEKHPLGEHKKSQAGEPGQ